MLFLAGYIAVWLFGKPDLIIAGILFGGSIFVILLNLIGKPVDPRELSKVLAEILP